MVVVRAAVKGARVVVELGRAGTCCGCCAQAALTWLGCKSGWDIAYRLCTLRCLALGVLKGGLRLVHMGGVITQGV